MNFDPFAISDEQLKAWCPHFTDKDRSDFLCDIYCRLFAFARSKGFWRHHDCEDFIGEVISRIAITGKSFEAGRPMWSWIYGIARNVALHRRRGDRNREKRLDGRAVEAVEAEINDYHNAGDDLQDMENRVQMLFERLTPAEQSVAKLYYFEGRSANEAAAILGITENAFNQRLNRMRARARELLGPDSSSD